MPIALQGINLTAMGTCPDAVKRLIDRFDQQSEQIRSPDYNEITLRIRFINPLFAELGWATSSTAASRAPTKAAGIDAFCV